MWCLVSQPNSVILEVEVDPKAKGQECLEKVCHCLGIDNESDYFGLKFSCAKGDELWLNLRNPIERQVTGIPPYRFALRVKFWVPPHLLLQDATRHQFFLNARLELCEGRLRVADGADDAERIAGRLVALLAQAEGGGCARLAAAARLLCANSNGDTHQQLLRSGTDALLHIKSMKTSAAEYWLLKEVSSMDNFGEEVFQSKTCNGGLAVGLGVGPHGITIYQSDASETQSIPYTAIQSAASQRRSFLLTYVTLDSDETVLEVKLDSCQAASGLYRAITEKHAFYSCETVRSAVTAQFIRDLKGTIVSIFNEDTSLGKKYVFDIQRTCREVYDNARRALYQSRPNIFPTAECDEEKMEDCASLLYKASVKDVCAAEALACRICMDRAIDTALFPCGHVLACGACAARCRRCPLCRAHIAQWRQVFLPLTLTNSGLQPLCQGGDRGTDSSNDFS